MELNGISTLIGVVTGAAISFVKDLILARNQRKIEKMKLHDKNKMAAYKHLIKYAKGLAVITWPDNDSIYSDFFNTCRDNFSTLIESYPYYSKDIMKILDKIESLYHMTLIDVNWETPPRATIEKELPEIANKLYKQVIDDFKKWQY